MDRKLYTLLKIILFLILYSNYMYVFGQSRQITGNIIEKKNKKEVAYATVAIYNKRDTSLVNFRISDEKGNFSINVQSVDSIYILISVVGKTLYRKNIKFDTGETNKNLGTIEVDETVLELGEINVIGETLPVIIKKDTIEFNANSFKTLPTSLVEDLLKKLPGVTVSSNGQITVNGKIVTKILVDGKEFFGNDPKLATRNLPSNIVDKVVVTKNLDALRRNPDLMDNQIPIVINLKLKKEIKKGVFGKLYLGSNVNNRYETGGILNLFRDTTQISLLGYSNNLSKPAFGFEDISSIGGFDRSGYGDITVQSDGGYSINGISFGATGEGIQKSTGGGTNINTITKNKTNLNFQYFSGIINSNLEQESNITQLNENNNLYITSNRRQINKSNSDRIGSKIELNKDPNTYISIAPYFESVKMNSESNVAIVTKRDNDIANSAINNQTNNNSTKSFKNEIFVDKYFKNSGRSISYNSQWQYSKNTINQINEVTNSIKDSLTNSTNYSWNRNISTNKYKLYNNLQFRQPINKKLSFVIKYDNVIDINELETKTRDILTNQNLNNLSGYVYRTLNKHTGSLNFKHKSDNHNFTLGIQYSVVNSITKSNNSVYNILKNVIRPTFNLDIYKFSMSYNSFLKEPDLNYINPIIDATNPLYVYYGNPNLIPSVVNTMQLSYKTNNPESRVFWSNEINGIVEENPITVKKTIDTNGVQIATPINVNKSSSLNYVMRISKEFSANNVTKVVLTSLIRTSVLKIPYVINDIESNSTITKFDPSLEIRINYKDKLELFNSLSLNRQISVNGSDKNEIFKINTTSLNTEFLYRVRKNLALDADFSYKYNSNIGGNLQKAFSRLNIGITYSMLKKSNLVIKGYVFDALNQNISIFRNVSSAKVEDIQTNVLKRYFLLTLTYNIQNFGQRIEKNNPLFRF